MEIIPGVKQPPARSTKKHRADRLSVKRANRKRFHDGKKRDKVSVANRIAVDATADLKEIRELAKMLRPFLENGAILLGEAFDQLVADQLTLALTGTQHRMIVDKSGVPVLGDDGEPLYGLVAVDPKDQTRTRQQLIELFPKLIPADTSRPQVDPLETLWRRLNSKGGRMAIEIDGETDPNEPGEEVTEAVGRIIGDNGTAAAIDLAAQNA